MRGNIRALSALLFILLLASCGPAARGGAVEAERTTLRVENQSWSEMVIYVLRSGTQRIRIGSVPGVTTRTLTIPQHVVGIGTPLRFIADPIGSDRAPVTNEMHVYPGDQIQMYIPPR